MANELTSISLKCPGCGAALNVSPDMEQFSCGYCGSEQIVLRRGGTVALSLIGDAIAKVQAGTDRTAAELAIQRLREDLAKEDAEFNASVISLQQAGAINPFGSLTTFLFVAGVMFLFIGKALGVLIGIGFIAAGIFLYRDQSASLDAIDEYILKLRRENDAKRRLISKAIEEKLKEVA